MANYRKGQTRYYMADFETTTDENDCRVWCWGLYNIFTESFEHGKDIASFCRRILNEHATVYFHNLTFDGEFILHYIMRQGYTLKEGKKFDCYTYEPLIGDNKSFYMLQIKAERALTTFVDSLKILTLSVKKLGKAYKMPIQKGEIDYNMYRPVGYEPTAEELDYLYKDVAIPGKIMRGLLEDDMKKITAGSNAFSFYQGMIGDLWRYYFPHVEADKEIRRSYRGGFVLCNPKFQGRKMGPGIVLDVNSLYPSVMRYKPLPYGIPKRFQGKYEYDADYPLYVQNIFCAFELKPGKLPTIQLKNNLGYIPTEYITSTNGEPVSLCLTSVDLDLFFECYEVEGAEYLGGFKFMATDQLFAEYVDHWMGVKIKAEQDGNFALRNRAKLFMNSLYGKFATRPQRISVKPELLPDGRMRYVDYKMQDTGGIYIPVGTFITSWARDTTIRAALKVIDRFMYADTDSLHLLGTELPTELEIDKYKLGAWKHETTFERAKYWRAKRYMETGHENGRYFQIVKAAGMPDNVKKKVTWNNFKPGMIYYGKLQPKHVPNGIVLVPGTFEMND